MRLAISHLDCMDNGLLRNHQVLRNLRRFHEIILAD
jgi:hypothetical protein